MARGSQIETGAALGIFVPVMLQRRRRDCRL